MGSPPPRGQVCRPLWLPAPSFPPSPGLVLGLACDECCGFHMHCDRDLGPESPSVVVPFLSSPEIKYLFPPVDCLFILIYLYSFFNSCLFYYSCPNFPLCLPPSSPPIPTVHPHTVVYGSFIYALWLIPSPSFYHSPLPLMHPHVHSSTVYNSKDLETA